MKLDYESWYRGEPAAIIVRYSRKAGETEYQNYAWRVGYCIMDIGEYPTRREAIAGARQYRMYPSLEGTPIIVYGRRTGHRVLI